MTDHCCSRMAEDLSQTCTLHEHRSQCPDALIGRIGEGYGILVHDGGSSMIAIAFCPWCGTALPTMQDDEDEAIAAPDATL